MDLAANGDAKQIVKNGVGQGSDVSGWLFRLIQEGWLRKRWRKRWCIVKHDKLFMYEFEPANDQEEKECGVIELEYYQKCAPASKKECKKSPHTFTVELTKTDDKAKQKNKAAPQREMFYAENEAEKKQWLKHLNDKIAAARLGYAKTLDHVTKSRPKPSSRQRRPPTRNHLRERANQSEMITEFNLETESPKVERVKRGHVPAAAIKPPPGGAKPKLNSSPSLSSEILPSSTDQPEKVLSKIPPKPPLKPKNKNDQKEKSVDASPAKVMPGTPPPAPPKALKPKMLNLSVGEAITEEEEPENAQNSAQPDEEEVLIAEGIIENSDEGSTVENVEDLPFIEDPSNLENISFPPVSVTISAPETEIEIKNNEDDELQNDNETSSDEGSCQINDSNDTEQIVADDEKQTEDDAEKQTASDDAEEQTVTDVEDPEAAESAVEVRLNFEETATPTDE